MRFAFDGLLIVERQPSAACHRSESTRYGTTITVLNRNPIAASPPEQDHGWRQPGIVSSTKKRAKMVRAAASNHCRRLLYPMFFWTGPPRDSDRRTSDDALCHCHAVFASADHGAARVALAHLPVGVAALDRLELSQLCESILMLLPRRIEFHPQVGDGREQMAVEKW